MWIKYGLLGGLPETIYVWEKASTNQLLEICRGGFTCRESSAERRVDGQPGWNLHCALKDWRIAPMKKPQVNTFGHWLSHIPAKSYLFHLMRADIEACAPARSLDAGCGELRNFWMFPGE